MCIRDRYIPCQYSVEGDWSGTAFLLVAGAIAGEVEVTNLYPLSLQPDREIVNALIYCGAYVSIRDNGILVRQEGLNGFHFDATHCPDLFPPLVALASHCRGESRILGVSRLKVKESDRGAALVEEYSKMGVGIAIQEDVMIIRGGKPKSAHVQSHNDHRIAMSLSLIHISEPTRPY